MVHDAPGAPAGGTDTAMDVDAKVDDAQGATEGTAESSSLVMVVADIRQNVTLIEKAVSTIESRFTTRALRNTASVRRRLSPEILSFAVSSLLPTDNTTRQKLLAALEESKSDSMDTGGSAAQVTPPKQVSPESEVYLGLLVVICFHDSKKFNEGLRLSGDLIELTSSLNRRTMDQLAARLYYYHARFFELLGKLSEVRGTLLAAHRTATLRRDEDCQATLMNLLLRNYLHYNLYDQADKLVSKSVFPESANNNQLARYMYYLGRIRAIQLDYTSSHRFLQQAIRKAPQNAATVGFLQTTHKLSIIVQLLMGEIPDRAIFRHPQLRKALVPYFHITQAVRVGDLAKFQDALTKNASVFQTDNTFKLILRLRHNVIKTGVRMISLSYSCISLRDICLKLQLDSEEDAEYIVAKAIRDGVIDASIDHEKGYMKSRENVDVYSTNEPQTAFNSRIAFCLNLHNESVKAMRFPSNAYRKELGTLDEMMEEEKKLAKEIVDGELGDEDEDF
ncbi:proteasome regulatory subunit C-terminal-domain-containing protein [Hyaloraphidium curvatum]|nr:proteasome regulatory subunit C-terminal-domain-containing protein [Hyaloraphidium curvatum]